MDAPDGTHPGHYPETRNASSATRRSRVAMTLRLRLAQIPKYDACPGPQKSPRQSAGGFDFAAWCSRSGVYLPNRSRHCSGVSMCSSPSKQVLYQPTYPRYVVNLLSGRNFLDTGVSLLMRSTVCGPGARKHRSGNPEGFPPRYRRARRRFSASNIPSLSEIRSRSSTLSVGEQRAFCPNQVRAVSCSSEKPRTSSSIRS